MAEEITYRELKEQFVSHHNGTSITEVAVVALISPISVLANIVTCHVLFQNVCSIVWLKFVIDFVILVLPCILLGTILSDKIDATYLAIFLLIAALLLFQRNKVSVQDNSGLSLSNVWNAALTGKRPFITYFRAYVLIATAVMILAIDFPTFPRRFGKAETYGTGIMDAGVGSFIISNAIVSPEARGKYPIFRGFKQRFHVITKAVQSCIPLVIVGLARMVSVKATDYQEHVSEYGVHWNFFFTLIVVKMLSTIILCIWGPNWSWLISIALASGHQYLLQGKGFRKYILHGPHGNGSRTDIISANREGIFSCIGYLAIYFAGVQIGQYLFQHRVKIKEWIGALAVLVFFDLLFLALLAYLEEHVEPVSRRMANLSFIVWIMVYNLHMLAAFLLVDMVAVILEETGFFTTYDVNPRKRGASHFCLLEAVNRNGLFYFLLANLLTGTVNFAMQTIHAPVATSVLVLVGYMFIVSLIAGLLHMWNVTLRFW